MTVNSSAQVRPRRAKPLRLREVPAGEHSLGAVVFYESHGGGLRLEVRLEQDTVWLTQTQMAELFRRDQSVISRHMRNVFEEGELDEPTNMQKMHISGFGRPTILYSLDVVVSVGYRVKSPEGTQFRIWATRILKEHLVRGYTLNEQRLRERGLTEMRQAVALLGRTLTQNELVTDEGRAVLHVIEAYSRTWHLLLAYDENRLETPVYDPREPREDLSATDARALIDRLRQVLASRGEVTGLFGLEREQQLPGILAAIQQTFAGVALYRSAHARAAHLLYFLIKDHPFVDGNKRIGTLLFLEYLRRNQLLTLPSGGLRFPDSAMVAIALLVAASEPCQKELMVRLILNLLGTGEAAASH
jgi:prophage maintenance system killer protein